MEDHGSDFSKTCEVCGKTLPAECDTPGCQAVSSAAVCACGSTTPCEKDPCLLSHAAQTYKCAVCDQEVEEGTVCSRIDCPRVAAAQIRKASIDTPFKLGL
jgi:hypothetical protein